MGKDGVRDRNRGASPGRGKISQDTWRRILDAAAQTFAVKGYEATRIRDIAESVGMLGGSLYYYIDTKEDLLYALIDDFHRVGMEEVDRAEREAAAAGHANDPLATLRAVCERHAEVNAQSGTLSAVFYNDFRHLSGERKQHIVESRRRHQHRIEELLDSCQRSGKIRGGVDTRLTALAMLSLLNATNTWYHPEKDTSGESIGRFLSGLLIDGLAVRDATVEAPTPKATTRPTAGAAKKAPARKTSEETTPAKKASQRTADVVPIRTILHRKPR